MSCVPAFRSTTAPSCRGVSLIELMVAMALSLILLAGVIAIFASSRTTYETTDRLSRIQENGRFALDMIVRDVRAAGYLGCSRRAEFFNALNTPTTILWNFERSVEGFDAQGSDWEPDLETTTVAISAAPGNDAFVVRIPRPEFEPIRVVEGSLMLGPTDPIQIPAALASRIAVGDIVQVSDCQGFGRAVFQVTENDPGDPPGVLSHAAVGAAGNLPGNSTDDVNFAFNDLAEVVPVQSVLYYVRPGSTPGAGTSLWRRVSGSGVSEELVEGVENMQVLYGQETGSTIDYRRADQVTDWSGVVSVRVALLVRSLSEYGTDTDQGSYDVLDVTVANPGDRHFRQVFTTTINIRNATS